MPGLTTKLSRIPEFKTGAGPTIPEEIIEVWAGGRGGATKDLLRPDANIEGGEIGGGIGGIIPEFTILVWLPTNEPLIPDASAGGGMGGAIPDAIPGGMPFIMGGALIIPTGGPPMKFDETGLVMPIPTPIPIPIIAGEMGLGPIPFTKPPTGGLMLLA
jgi:hypothetical protein